MSGPAQSAGPRWLKRKSQVPFSGFELDPARSHSLFRPQDTRPPAVQTRGASGCKRARPVSEDFRCLWAWLASLNPVACDALATWLMGLETQDIGYLVHLDGMGFGPIDPAKMRILGVDPATLRLELERPSSYPSVLEWR